MAGISLQNFSNIAQHNLNSRLTLDEHNQQLRPNGERNVGNIFKRAWDCLTRSSAEAQANKATAKAFVHALKEQYGDKVATLASSGLSAHLDKGRPLTSHRIERILNKAELLQTQMQRENRNLLNLCLPDLTQTALARLGEDATNTLSPEQAQNIVRQAVQSTEAFQILQFMTDQYRLDSALEQSGLLTNETGRSAPERASAEMARQFLELSVDALQAAITPQT